MEDVAMSEVRLVEHRAKAAAAGCNQRFAGERPWTSSNLRAVLAKLSEVPAASWVETGRLHFMACQAGTHSAPAILSFH